MSCSSCARIRRRIREIAERARAAAASARASRSSRATAKRTGLTRRKFLVDVVAAIAISTGLARTQLELVDVAVRNAERDTITFKGLELAWSKIIDAGGQPDVILVNPEIVRRLDPELYARIMETSPL